MEEKKFYAKITFYQLVLALRIPHLFVCVDPCRYYITHYYNSLRAEWKLLEVQNLIVLPRWQKKVVGSHDSPVFASYSCWRCSQNCRVTTFAVAYVFVQDELASMAKLDLMVCMQPYFSVTS